ncbi:hypothetical protein AX17_003139 [Amanita inopinata Kibby_2008]|nr:hypothetical protein AX17_003139 [Amanita inopinata Kibby_2008]
MDTTGTAETTFSLSKELSSSSLPSRNKGKITSQARRSVSPYPSLPLGSSDTQPGTGDNSLLKLRSPKKTTALLSTAPAAGGYASITEMIPPHAGKLSLPQFHPALPVPYTATGSPTHQLVTNYENPGNPLEIVFPPELCLTPVPPEGFPEVYGLDVVEVFRYVSHISLGKWISEPSNKILVYLANDTPVYNTVERMERIRAFLNVLFPSHPSIMIDCPVLWKKMMRFITHKPIFPYLVAGLTDLQKHILLSRRVWSTKMATLFAIPFDPPVSSYALALAGINLTPPHEHANTVAAYVHEALSENYAVRDFIEAHHDNINNAIKDKVSFILDNISVRGQLLYRSKNSSPIFFVYIHPPTKLSSEHDRWLAMLRGIQYGTSHGVGEHVANEWKCNLCKGFDHPTGLCRYPSLPGWNPPPRFRGSGRRGRHTSRGVPNLNEREDY